MNGQHQVMSLKLSNQQPEAYFILKENIIHKVINKLETLECGLFKLSKHTKNINFLFVPFIVNV